MDEATKSCLNSIFCFRSILPYTSIYLFHIPIPTLHHLFTPAGRTAAVCNAPTTDLEKSGGGRKGPFDGWARTFWEKMGTKMCGCYGRKRESARPNIKNNPASGRLADTGWLFLFIRPSCCLSSLLHPFWLLLDNIIIKEGVRWDDGWWPLRRTYTVIIIIIPFESPHRQTTTYETKKWVPYRNFC